MLPNKKCVICLDDCIAKNRCSQCNICIMCSKCFENQYDKCPTCRLECDYCKNNIEHSTCTWTKNWHSDNCEICILISDKLFEKTLNLLMKEANIEEVKEEVKKETKEKSKQKEK